jgi:hypothetical protein
MPPDRQPQGEGDPAGANRPFYPPWETDQLPPLPGREGGCFELGQGQLRPGLDPGHVAQGARQGLPIQVVAAGQPAPGAAEQAHSEALLHPASRSERLAGKRKLEELQALEVSLDQVSRPIGDLGQGPGHRAGVEDRERHGSPLWHRAGEPSVPVSQGLLRLGRGPEPG